MRVSRGLSLSALLFLLSTLFSGCVHPKVTYKTDPPDDYDGHIKFRLVGTRLVLGETEVDPANQKKNYVKINAEKQIKASKAAILEVPREDESNVYAVVPQSQWLWTVETKLSVSYFDNTRLIKTVGTQVEDHRIKVIQAIGTIAKSAMALAPGNDEVKIPVAIDAVPDQSTWEPLPSNQGWVYLVTLKNPAKEPDAVPRTEYFKRYADKLFSIFSSTRTLPISSCKEAYLEIGKYDGNLKPRFPPKEKNQTEEQYQNIVDDLLREHLKKIRSERQEPMKWPVLIADYRFLRTYELPDKGSISSHTLCGADITTEKGDGVTSLEVLAEIVKQAKEIKESQK